MNCYYCEDILTSNNKSAEHVLPNAIGGRLKSKKLLCRKCNSLLGETYDSDLCNSLNIIAGLLNIERENGATPDIKKVRSESGKLYNLSKGRNPILIQPEINVNQEDNIIHISARDEKELIHIIEKLKRKYPTLNDKDLHSKWKHHKEYMDEPLILSLQAGGANFMKSVLKIAINFYLYNTGKKDDVQERIADLKKSQALDNNIIRHYYKEDSINYINGKEVSHTIFIKGDKKNKLLFAFIELFSSYAFIVNLNTNYEGPDLKYCYCYDVLTMMEISKDIDINYDGVFAGDITLLNDAFIKTLEGKFNRLMAIADQRQIDFRISEITKNAAKTFLEKYPEGTVVTEEIFQEYIKLVTKEAAPFIHHIHNKNRKKKNRPI